MLKINKVLMNEETGGEASGNGGGEAPTPTWFYQAPTEDNAGVPGIGESAPEWLKVDKYKSVEEQAKAYPELAKRFGGFESAPEDDYVLPEGFEEVGFDEGIIDIVKGIGKENHMSQNMFNQLISSVAEYESQKVEQAKAEQMQALGENAQERISKVNDWLNVNAPKEIVEAIVPMATSAEAIKALEFFIDKSKGSKVADNNAAAPTQMSQSEYADMLMATDNKGNLKISVDPEYKKKMDELTLSMQR